MLNSDCDEPERENTGEGGEFDPDCGPRGGEWVGDAQGERVAGEAVYGELPKIPLLEKAEDELEV